MELTLIEAIPSRLGSLHRDALTIKNAVMINQRSSNGVGGRRYSDAALKKIASLAEGLPGYLNHVPASEAFKPRDVRDIAVRWHNVRFDPSAHRVVGDMHVMPHHADLVFGLAERFGDHVGNSLVSKGAVRQEASGEVVDDILQCRSCDIVSDPATTRGLFESGNSDPTPLSIMDLAETLKGATPMDVMQAILDAVNGTSTPRPAAPTKPSAPQLRVISEGKELDGSQLQAIIDAINR